MKAVLDFFRGSRGARGVPAPRPRTARLAVESLEDRMVMSASTLGIHAVLDNFGSAVFYGNSNGFFEKDSSGNTITLETNVAWLKPFSAGVDMYGKADVFFQRHVGVQPNPLDQQRRPHH